MPGPIDVVALPTALQLLECLRTQVAKTRVPPVFVGMRAGQIGGAVLGPDLDECCAGLAWVRIGQVQPGGTPPGPQVEMTNCGPLNWIVTLELGVARCVPFAAAGTEANVLTQEQWDLMVLDQQGDFAAMVLAVTCCFASGQPLHYLIGQWTPSDAEGGCMASTMTVQVLSYAMCQGSC